MVIIVVVMIARSIVIGMMNVVAIVISIVMMTKMVRDAGTNMLISSVARFGLLARMAEFDAHRQVGWIPWIFA